MKIVRYAEGIAPHRDRLADDTVVPLRAPVHCEHLVDDLDEPSQPLAAVRLLAPVPSGKIICAGLNYRDHAAEAGLPVPASPLLFTKHPSAVVGPGADLRLPAGHASQANWEAEPAIVIGREGRDVDRADAHAHVLGYTCLNDVSARDVQNAESQWVRAKSFDTVCPVGPWVVTADELPDPTAPTIACRVNGETQQRSATAEMVVDVAAVVAFESRSTTLHPGDVIATGTPPGVGVGQDPPRLVRAGDTVEVEITSIGVLRNSVVAA